MERHAKIGIITLAIIVCLIAVIVLTMNLNEKPKMREIYTFPAPEERVIASFGLNETNPDRTVFLENPNLMDRFIIASDSDLNPYYYRNGGPVIGCGKEGNGSIAVMIDETGEVNPSVISEIYNRLSERGKRFNIQSVPCKFITMGFARPEVARDTLPGPV
ncbi:MAG: hypothetical protein LUQ31_05020 [Methanoregula sp.]|nr:hypothetical protein [Methanoregula sp.]